MGNTTFPTAIDLGDYAGFLGTDRMEVSSFPFAIKNTVDLNYHDGEYTLNLTFTYDAGSTHTGTSDAIVNQISNNIDHYSMYENNAWVNKYAVYYMVDGNLHERPLYSEGANVTLIDAPTKSGYEFVEWTGAVSVMPANNVTFVADYQGKLLNYYVDGVLYQTVEVGSGLTITPLANPTKTGYTFNGWQSHPTSITEDTRVDGTFTINQYTINYYVKGEIYDTKILDYNTAITMPVPNDYEESGKEYIFRYWYVSTNPNTPYVITNVPAGNLDLYAKFVDVSINIFEYELDANKKATIIGFNENYDNTTAIVVPEIIQYFNTTTGVIEEYPIVAIDQKAFMNYTTLSSFDLSASKITSIGASAFYGCQQLASIKFADTVNTIGSYAFAGCISLNNVTIPTLVTVINDYTFSSCSALTSIAIHKDVTSIGSSAFSGCTTLANVSFETGINLTNLGMAAFSGCTSLVSIVLPTGLTTIKKNTFLNCTKLTTVTIPVSVTTILADTFKNCTSFTTIEYQGTESQWLLISIDSTNTLVADATKNYLG